MAWVFFLHVNWSGSLVAKNSTLIFAINLQLFYYNSSKCRLKFPMGVRLAPIHSMPMFGGFLISDRHDFPRFLTQFWISAISYGETIHKYPKFRMNRLPKLFTNYLRWFDELFMKWKFNAKSIDGFNFVRLFKPNSLTLNQRNFSWLNRYKIAIL